MVGQQGMGFLDLTQFSFNSITTFSATWKNGKKIKGFDLNNNQNLFLIALIKGTIEFY